MLLACLIQSVQSLSLNVAAEPVVCFGWEEDMAKCARGVSCFVLLLSSSVYVLHGSKGMNSVFYS